MNIVVSMRGITSELSVIRNFTIPALLGGVMVMPVIWLVNTILVNQPGGYGELGLLSATNQWRTFLMFLPQAFLQVALPMMASGPTNSQTAAGLYGKTFSLTRSLTLLAVFPPAVVLMLVSSWIMRLYGLQFAGADPVLIGVISSVMVVATSSAVGPAIQAEGKLWFGFLQNASWGVLLLLLTALAAPVWGAAGVAFSFALSYGVLAIWSFLYLRPSLPARTVSRLFISLIFIAVAGASALTMSPFVRIAIALPAGVLTVAVTLFILVDEPVRASIVQSLRQKWWRAYSKPGSPQVPGARA
jgi:O-antigen/teichoic acid export membrane protein